MDYAAIAPEITSLQIYSGPGSAPLRSVSAAWQRLAGELHSAADGYRAVISGLTEHAWLGPSSAALAGAVTPYVGWLETTAGQAERTAAQAAAAASAYEAAFAMTVPPSAVTANRVQVLVLAATNWIGQHTPLIAALEALYGEMWAQDAAAMYGYAGSSAATVAADPFTPAPQTTRADGPVQQAVATAHSTTQQIGSGVQQALGQLSGPLNQVTNLAGSAQPTTIGDVLESVVSLFSNLVGLDVISAVALAMAAASWAAASANGDFLVSLDQRLIGGECEILNAIDGWRDPTLMPADVGCSGGVGRGSALVSARVGEAVSAGRLTVPMGWAANAPQIRTLSYTAPLAGPATAGVPAAGVGTAFSEMALAGMGGSALAGSVSRAQGEHAANTAERPPAPAATAEPAAAPLMGIAAEIREFAALRDQGLISEEQFTEQKLRLLAAAPPQPAPG